MALVVTGTDPEVSSRGSRKTEEEKGIGLRGGGGGVGAVGGGLGVGVGVAPLVSLCHTHILNTYCGSIYLYLASRFNHLLHL